MAARKRSPFPGSRLDPDYKLFQTVVAASDPSSVVRVDGCEGDEWTRSVSMAIRITKGEPRVVREQAICGLMDLMAKVARVTQAIEAAA